MVKVGFEEARRAFWQQLVIECFLTALDLKECWERKINGRAV